MPVLGCQEHRGARQVPLPCLRHQICRSFPCAFRCEVFLTGLHSILSASMVSLLSHLLCLQIVNPHLDKMLGEGGGKELEKERKYWHPLSPDSEMSPSLTWLQYCEMKWEVCPVSQPSFPHVQPLLERLCQQQQPGTQHVGHRPCTEC